MKKFLLTAFLIIISSWVFAQEKPVVAVAPFEAISGISTADANALTGVFFNRLGNANIVTLVDRSVVERVIREHQFQLSDWSRSEKTAELGEALNANWIVRGEIARLGSSIIVNVQFYDINTFQFRRGADIALENVNEAYNKMKPLVDSLVQTIRDTEQPIPAVPPGLEYNYFYYDMSVLIIKKYTGNAATLNIPAHIQDLPVTIIGESAFRDCKSLTSIIIPSSVTYIEHDAFYGCSSLTSITIPSSVMSIGDRAFYGCSSLTRITIPSSVTSISGYTFSGCSSLTNITIPPSVTSIYGDAFSGCRSLTSITIPSSVKSIDDSTFLDCRSLKNITIPSSVTSIGDRAFYGCRSLTSITIPSSVTTIGDFAFLDCSSLTSVTLSRRTRVGERAFPETARITYRD